MVLEGELTFLFTLLCPFPHGRVAKWCYSWVGLNGSIFIINSISTLYCHLLNKENLNYSKKKM